MNELQLNPGRRYRHPAFYLAILLLAAIVSLWPISFHIYSLKNDALNYFLPVRQLVSESLHEGYLPLWTPYLNLGYPLHGDMQSGAWNPVVQLFSIFGPYTLYTLQLETLLYVYLGGVGMFFLLKYFRVHPYAGIVAAVGYMLCGYNIDSCQFLNWIAGTAFLPFVFLFYYRCLKEASVKQGIYAGTALFFMFTGAYPADFIITIYLLVVLFIVHIISRARKNEKILTRSFILAHLLLLLTFLVLSSPAILSYIESLPLQERGTGASYDQVMSNPLHPYLISTFTTPLAGWKMPGVSVTDPLERNSWIGITAFIFLVAGFLTRSQAGIVRFIKWAILVFLLFSFGEMGGLRILSYYVLPLMDSFRHPANARMFTLFFCCLLAGFMLHRNLSGGLQVQLIKKSWWITAGIMILVLIAALFNSLSAFHPSVVSKWFSPPSGVSPVAHIKSLSGSVNFADLVLLSTVIQAAFMAGLYHFLVRKPNPKAMLITALANCMVFAVLLQPFTVIKKHSAAFVQETIDSHRVKGYPVPDHRVSLSTNSRDNEKFMGIMGCLNLYNKKIGRSDYRITPNNLLTQNAFWFNEPFRNRVMSYPFIYSPDRLTGDIPGFLRLSRDSSLKVAYSEGSGPLQSFPGDDSTSIELVSFSPNRFAGRVTAQERTFVVIHQNIYPRWVLTIDGKEHPVQKTNTSFMGFEVPAGEHLFEFRYRSGDLRFAFFLSLTTLAAVIIFSLIAMVRRGLNP